MEQLEYLYKNNPESLTEEEKKLYFDLKCKLKGDCSGGISKSGDDFAQSTASIHQKLNKTFEEIDAMSDAGKKFELKTAKKLIGDGVEITDLGNEIKGDAIKPFNSNQPTAGDRDIGTTTHLIES